MREELIARSNLRDAKLPDSCLSVAVFDCKTGGVCVMGKYVL
jgi:hypothetical protein